MPMTIPEALEWWKQRLGRSITLPTPPACAHLMNLAKAEGIPVGALSIVSRPLEAGSVGTYDRASGDLCCCYEASQGEAGQREILQTLLMLIASVKRQFPAPQTIGEEWEQVQQAIEEAYALARTWRQEAIFSEEDLRALLTQSVQLAMMHHAAGRLAGHQAPAIARQAYAVLHTYRGWFESAELFAQALAGTSPREHLNDALVDFDRSCLRERWAATSTRRTEEPATFGDLALPAFPRSARVLRSALAAAASLQCAPHKQEGEAAPRVFRHVRDETDLAELLHLVNCWLIDTCPQAAVRLHSSLYGDAYSMTVGAARLYRLSLAYEDLRGEHRNDDQRTREVWALFTDRRTLERRAIEGAWQRFLVSWLKWSEVQREELAVGLQALWESLEHLSPGL